MMDSDQTVETFARMLHRRAGALAPGESVEPPLVSASTYFLPSPPTAAHQYGRWTNPTWSALEDDLAVLEQADTVAFPSGMAAIAAVLLTQLSPGDRLLLPNDGYYTTRAFAQKYLVPNGVAVESCSTHDYATRDFTGVKLVWDETPSNPKLDLCDIADVVQRAHAAGAVVAADNTTMTPLGQRPLDLGADVLIAADTKAVNGHSDVLAGHVSARDAAVMDGVRDWRKLGGGIPGPFETWLVHRGLETLEVRFDRMCTTASTIAARFADQLSEQTSEPAGKGALVDVCYPGLATHPDHALAETQMLRTGTLIGLTLTDADAAEQFIAKAELIAGTTSFGGIHTSAERRGRWGDAVPDGFVRLSIGCEPTEALWTDLSRTLADLA